MPRLQYSILIVLEGKLNMAIILVPIENKQSSQIGILEVFADSLVAFLVPASYLTGLLHSC
jgi:hypothetical protein